MRWLKRIRVVFAILFSFAVTLLFLDFRNIIPVGVHTFFASTQLVPSIIRSVIFFSTAAVGLGIIVTLTLLYGRIYCSTLCPLGIAQDVVIRIARRMHKRRRYRYKQQHYIVHYSLFVLATVSATGGSVILLNVFEPFSNYGRMISNLFSPALALLNNVFVSLLESFGVFVLVQVPILHLTSISVIASLCFLAMIIYLSYTRGRLFCNLLCPAGALLGLLSRISLFKIVIDEGNCKECGLCERVCKANCIDSEKKKIDHAACVGCFNCLAACPTVGMKYQRKITTLQIDLKGTDKERRKMLRNSILPFLGMLAFQSGDTVRRSVGEQVVSVNLQQPISPPGSISVERFSELCTACHLCISSCPSQVLSPSFIEYGIAGIMQPKMNYDASYCNYECVLCSQVCPTGAILPIDSTAKKEIQIGKVCFNEKDCVVQTKNKDCGACSEHCPTKAVTMVPFKKNLKIPEIHPELCVGCGACEHACPVEPEKAIFVQANKIHQKAQKPQTKKAESVFDSSLEFPF